MNSLSLSYIQKLGILSLALIYGSFGSPSPEFIGLAEVIILLAIIFAMGVQGVYNALNVAATVKLKDSPLIWLFLLFLWGTIIGGGVGFLSGNSFGWIIRDYISFIFLCLPLFFIPYISSQDFGRKVMAAILCIGGLFSIRVLINEVSDTGEIGALYLSISPEVLFMACFATMASVYYCLGVDKAPSDNIYRKIGRNVSCPLIAMLGGAVLYQSIMRAGLAAMVICFLVFLGWMVIYRPKKLLLLGPIITVLIIMFFDPLLGIIQPALDKHNTVGGNLRFEELKAVSDQIGSGVLQQFIGLGWGAGIDSPSSNGMFVNFTHGLLPSLWLKTGVVGVALMVAFILSVVKACVFNMKLAQPKYIMLFTALMFTISINMTLYGGYKSLGFGLCLTLLVNMSQILKPND